MKVYKIRNKNTGEYSTGGTSPRWSRKGKNFTSYHDAKESLSKVRGKAKNTKTDIWRKEVLWDYLHDAEIVTFNLVESQSYTNPLKLPEKIFCPVGM